jgi:hypothetical protein
MKWLDPKSNYHFPLSMAITKIDGIYLTFFSSHLYTFLITSKIWVNILCCCLISMSKKMGTPCRRNTANLIWKLIQGRNQKIKMCSKQHWRALCSSCSFIHCCACEKMKASRFLFRDFFFFLRNEEIMFFVQKFMS